jgi:predicted nucleic acid-binding protein
MGRIILVPMSKVAMDSNCFFYLIEGSPYADMLTDLFQRIEKKSLIGVTSIITITEILTGPYKSKNYKLVEEYRSTLLSFPNLTFREMDYEIANQTAQCRAQYGLKTPNAIQLATAMLEKADVFITNDRDFKNVEFPILYL